MTGQNMTSRYIPSLIKLVTFIFLDIARYTLRDCAKNSGVRGVSGLVHLPSQGRRRFEKISHSRRGYALPVENTQPVGSLLSASPNSSTGIPLSETLSPQDPTPLERLVAWGGGRKKEERVRG